jgi:hypothetical protein
MVRTKKGPKGTAKGALWPPWPPFEMSFSHIYIFDNISFSHLKHPHPHGIPALYM